MKIYELFERIDVARRDAHIAHQNALSNGEKGKPFATKKISDLFKTLDGTLVKIKKDGMKKMKFDAGASFKFEMPKVIDPDERITKAVIASQVNAILNNMNTFKATMKDKFAWRVVNSLKRETFVLNKTTQGHFNKSIKTLESLVEALG